MRGYIAVHITDSFNALNCLFLQPPVLVLIGAF